MIKKYNSNLIKNYLKFLILINLGDIKNVK